MTEAKASRPRARGAHHVYDVFGGRLVSDVELPGLPEGEDGDLGADWSLVRAGTRAASGDEGELLAREQVQPGVEVRLLRAGDELSLAFDDSGRFDVAEDGSRIRWRPGASARPGDVRLDVLGRVIPLALHRQGVLSFHASAAVTADGAVAFLGPKGAGKSTMAVALADLGLPVLSDDVVPIEPGDPPLVRPGVPRLRVRLDVARAAGRGPSDRHDGERVEIDAGATMGRDAPPPLAALYLLAPSEEEGATARREPLTGSEAALAVLGQLKLGTLLAPWQGPELLRACAGVAGRVPVYRLHVPRDLARLEELARFVAGAHGDRPPGDP